MQNWNLEHSKQKPSRYRVRTVDVNDDVSHDTEDVQEHYAFSISSSGSKDSFVHVTAGGVQVNLLVDSGAAVNVMDHKLWESLKVNRVKCISKRSSKELFAYGGKPLTVIGSFQADVSLCNGKSVNTDFFVIQEEAPGILGKDTAVKLGLLKLESTNVNSVNERKTELMSKFPLCFTGIGKLKDYRLKIPIDPEVTPVVQPLRRIAYHLRKFGEEA